MRRMGIAHATMMSALLLCAGCNDALLGPDPPNTPVSSFDVLWSEFDRWYGLFGVKGIDWDSTYEEFRPRVTDRMSDAELFAVIDSMLTALNDCHVSLESPWGYHQCAHLFEPTYSDFNRVVDEYLTSFSEAEDYAIVYGSIDGDIGYINISTFWGENLYGADDWGDDMERILEEFAHARAIIVDVRDNGGGNIDNAELVAGYFTDRERLYQIARTRKGPEHDDFTEPFDRTIVPLGEHRFDGPIFLLTNRRTTSAAEAFTMAMTGIPNVIHIGDTTTGAISMVSPDRHLPNGWSYRFSIQDTRDAEGRSFEGIGIPPDSVVVELEDGVEDRMIEAVLRWVR